jgi:type I restriction enzyme S subunit
MNLYLKYILPSDLCFKQIKKRSKQGTVTNLHLEEIRELLIPLPSIEEQQKITNILSQITNLIEKRKMNKYFCENIKQGLVQKLLTGKIRVDA